MAVVFSNNAKTTLASTVSTSATSITVADGSVFPALNGADYTYVTLEDGSGNVEIVKVTALSSNALTVVRAQDNTSARAFSSGDKCELRLTAAGLNEVASQADTDTNTTYSVGDGGLSEINFTSADHTKLNGIATNANNYALPFTNNSTNWNTAYGWGNHASAGYLTSYTDTNTTYSIQDGELSQNNFTNADHTKLNGIATGANNYSHPSAHAISFVTGLQTALDGKVDDSQVLTNVPSGALFTDTTYSVGNGGLTQQNFTNADHTKLNGIATGANNYTLPFTNNSTNWNTAYGWGNHATAGYTNNVGDITGVTVGTGLDGGGTSGTVNITLDLSEFTDMTAAVVGTQDELILLDNGAERRKLISEITLSDFNNDSGWTSNVGDITGVTAGTGLTGGGSSGAVTLNVIGGSGITANANDIAVDSTVLRTTGAQTKTGALTIDVNNVAAGALRIEADITNPNQDFYFAQEIYSTLSGSQTTTADREQGGIYMDLNSTATGGDTSNEHRVYGAYLDVDSTGDADLVYGVYSNVTATPTTGQTTSVYGGYFYAEDNGGAGATSSIFGVQAIAYSDNATSDVNNMYAGYFKSYNAADSAAIDTATAVYGEIEVTAGSADIYGTSKVFEAQYDNNTGAAPTNSTYLYYGNYAGVLPTSAYGVYIADAVPNTFLGTLRLGDGSTSAASYGFVSDVNTGMYSPANHELGFLTAGGQRLKLTSTGATVTGTVTATGGNSTNWNTAYGWGNHASAGYLSSFDITTQTDSKYLRANTADTATGTLTVRDVKFSAGYHLQRSDHHSGHLEGSYNNVGSNGANTNPIYTIGASYNPASTTLGNMYGVGFAKNSASYMTGALDAGNSNGWGLYVAADGDARVFLNGTHGIISSTGEHYANSSLVWNAGNDGSGSGLDADTVDGIQGSNIVQLSGTQLITGNKSFTGTMYMADKLGHYGDSNTYMQFHAADQWRVVTGGTERLEVNNSAVTVPGNMVVSGTLSVRTAIDLADNDILRFGSGDDTEFFCNGSHMYMDLNSGIGNFYIRDTTTTRFTFDDAGHFTATGNITAYSDIRLKEDIKPIEDAVSKVQQLTGNTYTRNDLKDADRRYGGVIAQEVEVVLPEAVSESEDGTKTVDYNAMIALLVESVKELKAEVDDLKAQLENK